MYKPLNRSWIPRNNRGIVLLSVYNVVGRPYQLVRCWSRELCIKMCAWDRVNLTSHVRVVGAAIPMILMSRSCDASRFLLESFLFLGIIQAWLLQKEKYVVETDNIFKKKLLLLTSTFHGCISSIGRCVFCFVCR